MTFNAQNLEVLWSIVIMIAVDVIDMQFVRHEVAMLAKLATASEYAVVANLAIVA
jgi:hypothetical protein